MIQRIQNTWLYGLGWLIWASLLLPQVKEVFRGNGARWAYILLVAFLLSFLATPLVRLLARYFGVLDQPGGRKVHKDPTPLLGGLAIYLGFIAAIWANNIIDRNVTAILVASTGIMAVSLLDDMRELPAQLKLLVQIAATTFIYWAGIRVNVFPHQGLAELGNIVLTFIWVIGLTNAMNFLDGTDGLAAGLGIVISLFLGIVSWQTDHAIQAWLAIAMMGACLGFLPYNFRRSGPALIFLGDAGSTFIGFTLASLAIVNSWAADNTVISICAPTIVFGVLIFDMVHTTVARIATGKVRNFHEWLSYAGKDHIHHRMYRLFQSNKKAVCLILAMSACLGISAVALRNARPIDGILIVLQGGIAFAMFSALDYQQEQRRFKLEMSRSWFRVQEHFDVVVNLTDEDERFDGVVLDIGVGGARILAPPTSASFEIGAPVLISSESFNGAKVPQPRGRVVRKRPVMLNNDTEKYIELGIQFKDSKEEHILHIVAYLHKKQIERRCADFSRNAKPLPERGGRAEEPGYGRAPEPSRLVRQVKG